VIVGIGSYQVFVALERERLAVKDDRRRYGPLAQGSWSYLRFVTELQANGIQKLTKKLIPAHPLHLLKPLYPGRIESRAAVGAFRVSPLELRKRPANSILPEFSTDGMIVFGWSNAMAPVL
jgi:hypothetical protein